LHYLQDDLQPHVLNLGFSPRLYRLEISNNHMFDSRGLMDLRMSAAVHVGKSKHDFKPN